MFVIDSTSIPEVVHHERDGITSERGVGMAGMSDSGTRVGQCECTHLAIDGKEADCQAQSTTFTY